MKKNMK